MNPLDIHQNETPLPMVQTYSGFLPGAFFNFNDDSYLNSLDSDTRDYVIKHTADTRTRQDIINCVNRLHEGK